MRSLTASRLDLGIKRASEERHKRESEHYIVIYISQTNKQTNKNGWTSDVTFIRASSNTILDVKRGQKISPDDDGRSAALSKFELQLEPRCAMQKRATFRSKCRIFE